MLALLDTGYSNLKSYSNLLKYLKKDFEIVAEGKNLKSSRYDCVILPGVSTFGALSRELHKRQFTNKLHEFYSNGKKIIGTCSGMQILFDTSDESLGAPGLGLIKGGVKRFPKKDKTNINIGWRQLGTESYFFVHGYYCEATEDLDKQVFSKFNGIKFLAQLRKNNLYGFQCHPEKSGINGIKMFHEVLSEDG